MMDEDIDIEEHNILDNPQLKKILPHIDNIKQEPLDYDDNYEEYTNEYCDDIEEMDVYPYVDDDDEASDDSPSIEADPKLSPWNLRHPQVTLEDWGPHLQRSACFCNECKTLFATRNALDAHNMMAHSFLVAMDSPKEESPKQPSPSLSNKYCNHCNKHFDDYNQLIQHLYDLITAKKNMKARAASITIGTKPMGQVRKLAPKKGLYKCVYCSVYIEYKYNLRRHYIKSHNKDMLPTKRDPYEPKCKFCKCVYTDRKSYNIHIRVNHSDMFHLVAAREVTNDANRSFKCPHCVKTFGTEIQTKMHVMKVHHRRSDDHNTNVPVTNKTKQGLAKANTAKPRATQLVAVKSSLKIKSPHSKGTNKLTYYQCQKCMCCRERKRRLAHVCTPAKFRRACSKCQYMFSTRALTRHHKKHLLMKNLTRASITIVPYNITSKAKTTPHNQVATKPAKSSSNPVHSKATGNVYKCSCGIHFPTKESIMKHCTNCSPDQKISCKECVKCGLMFPTNALVNHTLNHHSDESKKFVVHNVPTLFKCARCKCLFMKRQSLSNHYRMCEGAIEGEKCLYCQLLFHKSVLPEHMESHLPVQSKEATKTKLNQIKLYKCRKCKIVFVEKRSAVEHSIAKMHSKQNVGCKVCGLRFLKRDLNMHIDLHHTKRKCTLEDFQFVTLFVPKSKTENTVKGTKKHVHVEDTPKHKVSNVHSRMAKLKSEANDTVNKTKVKPRLYERLKNAEKERLTDSTLKEDELEVIRIDNGTLFKCTRCSIHYCTKATFEKHVYLNHRIKWAAVDCPDCGRKFTKRSCVIHKNMNICKRDNLKCKRTVASTPIQEDLAPDPNTVPIKSPKDDLQTVAPPIHSSYDFKLYKCEQCNVYFIRQSTCYKHTLNHIPMRPVEYIACKLCNLQFSVSSLTYHVKKHHSGKEAEKVLVEKYDCKGLSDVKVDIYVHTIDRVQTNLVSTTTDDNDETPPSGHEAADINPAVAVPVVDTVSKDSSSLMDSSHVTVESTGRESENVDSVEGELVEKRYDCSFCGESFNSSTSKEIHQSLDHIDGLRDCKICGASLHASILDELHLGVKNDTFVCCICSETHSTSGLLEHSEAHKKVSTDS